MAGKAARARAALAAAPRAERVVRRLAHRAQIAAGRAERIGEALPGGDVRPVCKALNEAFGGRGGGKPGFCQGSLACTDFADVQNFLVNYHE